MVDREASTLNQVVDRPLQPLNHGEWLFTPHARKGLSTTYSVTIHVVFFRRLDAAFDAPFLRVLASATCVNGRLSELVRLGSVVVFLCEWEV